MYTKIYSRYTTETCTLNYTSAVVMVAAAVGAAAAATVLKQRFYDLLNGRKEH